MFDYHISEMFACEDISEATLLINILELTDLLFFDMIIVIALTL